MNKAISAGIGVGLGLIALAVIFLAPSEVDESPMGVELSDQIEIATEENKSYGVEISEGLELGDGSP